MPHLKAISGLEVYNAYKQFFDAYPGINNHGIRTYTEQELALILKSSTVPDTELFSLSYWKGKLPGISTLTPAKAFERLFRTGKEGWLERVSYNGKNRLMLCEHDAMSLCLCSSHKRWARPMRWLIT
jgi:hypothetical protein